LSLIHILVRVLQKLKFLSCILSKDFLHQGQACLERFRSISDKLDLLILGLGDLAALGNLLWHLLVSEKKDKTIKEKSMCYKNNSKMEELHTSSSASYLVAQFGLRKDCACSGPGLPSPLCLGEGHK
jgi:hypothetical protein